MAVKVTVVTITGNRPELFALCRRWVERQTRKPDRWLVSCYTGEAIDAAADVVQTKATGLYEHMQMALRLVEPGHHVVLMEDDDWYAREHIERLTAVLESGAMMSGWANTRFYNLPGHLYNVEPGKSPPEGGSAIHHSFVQRWADGIVTPKFQGPIFERHGVYCPGNANTYVAVKGVGYGLPGSRGASSKNDPERARRKGWKQDAKGLRLRSWLGADADAYLGLLR